MHNIRTRIARVALASAMTVGLLSGATSAFASSADTVAKDDGTMSLDALATTRTWGTTTSTNTAPWGQCTWGAKEKFKQATGVYPALTGNAKDWDTSARNTGWTVVLNAEARSIVVFEPGVQGANATYGHVAWVDRVEFRADGRYIYITEMNYKGVGVWSTRVVKDVVGMSYILAP